MGIERVQLPMCDGVLHSGSSFLILWSIVFPMYYLPLLRTMPFKNNSKIKELPRYIDDSQPTSTGIQLRAATF